MLIGGPIPVPGWLSARIAHQRTRTHAAGHPPHAGARMAARASSNLRGTALARLRTVLGLAAWPTRRGRNLPAARNWGAGQPHAARVLAHAAQSKRASSPLAARNLLVEPDGNAGRRADSRDAPYKQARTLLVLAESRGRASDTAGEAAALDEVRNLCALLSAEATATRPSPPAGLTAREGEVLRHIAAGESNREIAEALSVSVRTINRHIENLYQKIGVHGRAEATAYAYRHHLV